MINIKDYLNKTITIMTGAGVSAESGIKTFRDNNGLWENHRIEDVATPEAFKREPKFVWKFYKMRYQNSLEAKPNPAHYALAQFEEKINVDSFMVITQNVLEMHGSLQKCFCSSCSAEFNMNDIDLAPEIPLCPKCGKFLRPDIVWFGETPYYLKEIYKQLNITDLLIVIGTSGVVYPAAQFLQIVKANGAKTLGINLEKPDNFYYLDYFIKGKAGEILPDLLG